MTVKLDEKDLKIKTLELDVRELRLQNKELREEIIAINYNKRHNIPQAGRIGGKSILSSILSNKKRIYLAIFGIVIVIGLIRTVINLL